jgi:hypothetical protein
MMRHQLISCMIPFDGFIHNLLIKLTSVYAMKLHVRLFGSTQRWRGVKATRHIAAGVPQGGCVPAGPALKSLLISYTSLARRRGAVPGAVPNRCQGSEI